MFHTAEDSGDYFADQLEPDASAPSTPSSLGEALSDGSAMTADEIAHRLLAARLRHPLAERLYALRSARIAYVPFQFRPLLRLLRSDEPRLLIADEVGVGKTIEAGLILTELSARQAMARVLVVCPRALTQKWRAEMRRFDESFRVLNSSDLRYCLSESHLDGEWPTTYDRAIVNHELFRRSEYLDGKDGRYPQRGLIELDPPPLFDLVIVDEAHHARTPGTETNRLVSFLANRARAVVLLTATPLQTSRRDLFELLSIVRPDLFPSYEVFEEQLEPNLHLLQAARVLRSRDEDEARRAEAARSIGAALDTTWGARVLAHDPRTRDVQRRLETGPLDGRGRARLIREIEELHTLAHVMNRTRRRDIGSFTLREVRSVTVALTAAEQRVFDAVVVFRRAALAEAGTTRGGFGLDMVERQAASSVHAVADVAERILASHGIRADDLTDDPELVDSDARPTKLGAAAMASAQELLDAARSLPDEDPKLEELLTLVLATAADRSTPGKVLLFSFFLDTIEYLRQALMRRGVRVGVVTGRVVDEERESLRSQFRLHRDDPAAIDVLLSSDVGCEGLDYEFCDRLVNYDLPWNPMRVEQRIGRVDRFGQQSPKVFIVNLLTEGTVEERVFARCYERLRTFEHSVGDLEEVLGDMVSQLEAGLTRQDLTPAQQVELADRVAAAALLRAEEMRTLEAGNDDLIGVDELVQVDSDELDQRRAAGADDLRHLVERHLGSIGLQLVPADTAGLFTLVGSDRHRERLAAALRRGDDQRPAVQRFVNGCLVGARCPVTFAQALAVEHREAEMVGPLHPLVRAAAAGVDATLPLRGALRTGAGALPTGRYVVASDQWEVLGVRPGLRVVSVATPIGDPAGACDVDLDQLLAGATNADGSLTAPEQVDSAVATCADALEEQRRAEIERLVEINEQDLNRRVAGTVQYFTHLIERVQGELDGATDERIQRMKRSELARREQDRDERLAELEQRRVVDIVTRRLVELIVEIADAV